jgi:hypothetical protein
VTDLLALLARLFAFLADALQRLAEDDRTD